MRHLIISREYPPAPYPPGGIGTYVVNIARLLAEAGDTVHVLGQRWSAAPLHREMLVDGRLIVHRVAEDDLPDGADGRELERLRRERDGLRAGDFPVRWFSWAAAHFAERLVEQEGVDVIEAQEWEAPLHHLLMRRAAGLGPRKAPPCLVHLHSGTEFIYRFNGGIETDRSYPSMKRLEAFCVREADALLCPSRSYAGQVAAHYGLDPGAVSVIPLPVGHTPFVERSAETWARGSICFVGRLEPRKGVIEWMAAAARVAAERPDVSFDFVGACAQDMQNALVARLDPGLWPRFRFHGSKQRAEILPILAGAMAGVVPSRWENFPNVCIEAMRSGLPVIATRLGGMAEMIEDGHTGWLVADETVTGMVDGLVEALRRCLDTPPVERAAMGKAASLAITAFCDNDRIVAAHRALRGEMAASGARRFWSAAPAGAPATGSGLRPSAGVVLRTPSPHAAARALAALAAQTTPPAAIALVCSDGDHPAGATPPGVVAVAAPGLVGVAAWRAGFVALDQAAIGFWLFLDENDLLEPFCIERMAEAFARRPDLGALSPWTFVERRGALEAPPGPELAAQLVGNDATLTTAFRADAIGDAPPFRQGLPRGYDVWDGVNRVLTAGWSAASLPEALALRRGDGPDIGWPESTALRAMRAELLADLVGPLGRAAVSIAEDLLPPPLAQGHPPIEQRAGLAIWARIARAPRRVLRWGRRRLRALLRRLRGRAEARHAL